MLDANYASYADVGTRATVCNYAGKTATGTIIRTYHGCDGEIQAQVQTGPDPKKNWEVGAIVG